MVGCNLPVKLWRMRAALLHSFSILVGHHPSPPTRLAALLRGHPTFVLTECRRWLKRLGLLVASLGPAAADMLEAARWRDGVLEAVDWAYVGGSLGRFEAPVMGSACWFEME